MSGSSTDPSKLAIGKFGAGTLTLTGPNAYTGKTVVHGGGLTLAGAGSLAAPGAATANQLTVASGGTFTMDNTITNSSARITGTAANFGTTLSGGTFSFLGNTAQTAAQTMGPLTLAAGASTVNVAAGYDGGSTYYQSAMTFGGLTRSAGSGATLNVTAPAGQNLGVTDGASPQLFATGYSSGTPAGNSWAFVNGSDFALYTPTQGFFPMVAGSRAMPGITSRRPAT